MPLILNVIVPCFKSINFFECFKLICKKNNSCLMKVLMRTKGRETGAVFYFFLVRMIAEFLLKSPEKLTE